MALANFQRSFQEARARHTDRRALAGIEKTIAGIVIFASKEGTCQLDMSLHGECTSHPSDYHHYLSAAPSALDRGALDDPEGGRRVTEVL
jgi:hypothetical protein